jgi:hypothetical protein
MRGDTISNCINDALGYASHNADFLSPDLASIIAQQEETKIRQLENEHLVYEGEVFNDCPLGGHYNEKIQKIIDCLKDLDLPLKLYSGHCYLRYWGGSKLDKLIEKEVEQFKLINNEGQSLRFDLGFSLCAGGAQTDEASDDDESDRVHAVMYQVEEDAQGSFFKCNRFWHQQLKPLLLDRCGFKSIWGRATWSSNTFTRGRPSKEFDWRWQYVCTGLDSSLRPIYLNKLYLFYLRMGFVADVRQMWDVMDGKLDQMAARDVYFFSDEAEQELRGLLTEEAWNELTKYNRNRLHEWRAIQKERMTKVNKKELDELKELTLKSMYERQREIDSI